MKKLLRLSELKRYYEEKNPSKIIYYTNNQEPDGKDGFQSIGITFRSMTVSISPDLIILKIGDGYIKQTLLWISEYSANLGGIEKGRGLLPWPFCFTLSVWVYTVLRRFPRT